MRGDRAWANIYRQKLGEKGSETVGAVKSVSGKLYIPSDSRMSTERGENFIQKKVTQRARTERGRGGESEWNY